MDTRPTLALPRRAVLIAQASTSTGLAAVGAGGGLLAVEASADPALAAIPLGMLVLGTGIGAPIAGAVMSSRGRVAGLSLCYTLGGLGAMLVVAGAWTASLPLVFAGNLLMGFGNAATMLTRFVVADLSPPHRRAQSIGVSMWAISAGAVLGPMLLGPAGMVAAALGLPRPAGLYLVAVVALASGPVVLRLGYGGHPVPAVHRVAVIPNRPVRPPFPALAALGAANLAMVALMAVAPVHLTGHGHHVGPVGVVIGLHLAGMYLAAPLFGRWVDRLGPVRVLIWGASALTLVSASLAVAPPGLAPAGSLLAMLGLAWSVQFVAGSALLAFGVRPVDRPRAEALGEVVMAAGAALGTLVVAGPAMARGGLALLATVCAAVNGLVVVLLAVTCRRRDGLAARGGCPAELTFLFSDIVNSTVLLRELGEAYIPLLERHRNIIRAAVDERGGKVMGLEGDGCFAVFADPASAVEAALAAQCQLQLLRRGPASGLLVRMGVHSGTARWRDGELIGYDVHRAARVAGVARGGEVVVSEEARAALPGVAFHPLGSHLLRGLDSPMSLFGIAAVTGTGAVSS